MRKALLIVSLTILMAVSVPSSAATPVVAAGLQFVPPAVVAAPNDTITLRNADALPHSLAVPSGLSGSSCRNSKNEPICSTGALGLGESGSFSLQNAPAGTYRFVCEFHGSMFGFLTVR